MVSYEPVLLYGNEVKFAFSGLSTDTKPVKEYAGSKIANSSTFFEMDTLNLKFYDASTDTWI